MLELGAMEVGLPDRSRNPKPRTQLPLAREGINSFTSLSSTLQSLSMSQTQQEVQRKKARVMLLKVNFSIRKCITDKSGGRKFVDCDGYPVSEV